MPSINSLNYFCFFKIRWILGSKKITNPKKKKKITSNFSRQYECLYRLIVNMVSKMVMSWSLVKWHLIKYSGLKVRIVCRRSSIFRLAAEISTVLETTSQQSHRTSSRPPPPWLRCHPVTIQTTLHRRRKYETSEEEWALLSIIYHIIWISNSSGSFSLVNKAIGKGARQRFAPPWNFQKHPAAASTRHYFFGLLLLLFNS